MAEADLPLPLILPLGDQALLVRFDSILSDVGNRAAIAFARRLRDQLPAGVTEIDPNLISVLLKYDPERTDFEALSGQVRLLLWTPETGTEPMPTTHRLHVRFGGEDGPDLEEAAAALGMTPDAFVSAHNATPLRVLATGFAPGFVYCGFHPETMRLPRRADVRPPMPAGSVLFAAGQTAITSTAIPTGWHVIGRTDFRNFDPVREPPTLLVEGDAIVFEAVSP